MAACIAETTSAQKTQIELKYGPEIDSKRFSGALDIMGGTDKNLFIKHMEQKGMFGGFRTIFANLDINSLSLKGSSELKDLKADGEEVEYSDAAMIDGKLTLFTYRHDKKDRSGMLYQQTVNTTTMMPNSDAKLVIEAEEGKVASGMFAGYAGRGQRSNALRSGFDITYSRDTSKILVYKQLPFDKEGPAKVMLAVYDKSMKQIWKKDFALPYNDNLFSILDYSIDNSGKVYALGKLYNDKMKESRGGDVNYQLKLVAFDNNSLKPKDMNISLSDDKFIRDAMLFIDKKGTLIVTGLYTKARYRGVAGSFYITADGGSMSVKTTSFKDLPVTVLTQNMSDRKASKVEDRIAEGKDVELASYDFDKVIFDDNGEVTLFGEQYYVTTHTVTSGNTTRTVYTYHYNDILVVRVAADGTISWSKLVPKRQLTSGSTMLFSYYATVRNGNVYVIYNDNFKNMDVVEEGRFKAFGGGEGATVMVTFDNKGNSSKQLLVDGKADVETMIAPRACRKLDANNILLFGVWRKTHQFAKLTFK